MQSNLSQEQLDVVINFKSQQAELLKARQGIQGLKKDAEQMGASATDGLKSMQKEFRDTLLPLRLLNTASIAFGVVWGATYGTVIKSVRETKKVFDELAVTAGKLGITFQEAARQRGLFLTSEDVKNVDLFTRQLEVQTEKWANLTTKVGAFFASIKGVAGFFGSGIMGLASDQFKDKTDPWKQTTKGDQNILGGLQDQIKILKGQGDEVTRQEMQSTLEKYRNTYGRDGEITKTFEDFMKLKNEQMTLSAWGFKQNWQDMRDSAKDSLGAMKNAFGGFVTDAFQNKLKSAKEYFKSFTQDILSIWSKLIMEMVMKQALLSILGMGGGGGGGGGGFFSSVLSGMMSGLTRGASTGMGGAAGAAGGGGYYTPLTYSSTSGMSGAGFAKGGLVGTKGVETITVGEQGAEYVVPAWGLKGGRGGDGEGNTYNYYDIKAVDTQSFVSALTNNSGVITAIVEKAVTSNQSIRKTFRDKI